MATYSDVLDRILRSDYDHASSAEREEASRKATQACAAAAAALTIQPLPFLDLALIAPVQIAMVQAIGRVHGYRVDGRSTTEILSTLGASIVAQNAAMAAAKFVPVLGWVVAPSMAFALTWAIGEVSDLYFREGRQISPSILRQRFREVYRTKRAEKQRAHAGDASLRDRLERLKADFEAGVIDGETFTARKEALLADF